MNKINRLPDIQHCIQCHPMYYYTDEFGEIPGSGGTKTIHIIIELPDVLPIF